MVGSAVVVVGRVDGVAVDGAAVDGVAVDGSRTLCASAVVTEIVVGRSAVGVECVDRRRVVAVVRMVRRLVFGVEAVDRRLVATRSADELGTVVSNGPTAVVEGGNRLMVCETSTSDPTSPEETDPADPSIDSVPYRNPMPSDKAPRQTARIAIHSQPCHPSPEPDSRPISHQCNRWLR